MQTLARRSLPWAVAAFGACVVLQVFLAGLGVFDDPGRFVTHREFGYTFGWLTLLVLVLALVGRAPRRVVGLAALLLGQFALQSILIALRTAQPAVAALHPVNGMLILVVTVALLRESRAAARVRVTALAEPDPAHDAVAGRAA